MQSITVTTARSRADVRQVRAQLAFSASSPLNTSFLLARGHTTPLASLNQSSSRINSVPQVHDGRGDDNHPDSARPPGGYVDAMPGVAKDQTKVWRASWRAAYPQMPIECARQCADHRQVARLTDPAHRPTLFTDVRAGRQIPTHEWDDLRLHRASRARGHKARVLHRPGPGAGTNVAYFGPPIRFWIPQPGSHRH